MGKWRDEESFGNVFALRNITYGGNVGGVVSWWISAELLDSFVPAPRHLSVAVVVLMYL